MELNLSALLESAPEKVLAGPLSGYPATTQDVALVVEASLPSADLQATLQEGAGELLEHIELFDVYAGTGIEDGRKSMAYALRFRAQDRTLTADEASEARAAAVSLAQQRHGAEQRS